MNSKLSISLALSIVAHALILLTLINIYPRLPNPLTTTKNNILTVNFLRLPAENLIDPLSNHKHSQSLYNNISERNTPNTLNDAKLISTLTPPIKYYKLSELDQKPEIIGEIDNNPIELRQYPQGGQVTIRLWLDEDGKVIKTEIVESELPEEFNKSTLKRFQDAKFLPGMKNNRPVNSVVKIMIQYAAIESAN